MSDTLLAGRVAVVSGGGRGLGRSFCRALARQGAKVVVNNRNRVTDVDGRGPADHVAAEIVAGGGDAVADTPTRPTRPATAGSSWSVTFGLSAGSGVSGRRVLVLVLTAVWGSGSARTFTRATAGRARTSGTPRCCGVTFGAPVGSSPVRRAERMAPGPANRI